MQKICILRLSQANHDSSVTFYIYCIFKKKNIFFSVASYSLEKGTWFSLKAIVSGKGSAIGSVIVSVLGGSKTPEPEKSTGLDESSSGESFFFTLQNCLFQFLLNWFTV